ncbi:MAG: EamA family transporter [Candidatus Andersenbacteria bacterium]
MRLATPQLRVALVAALLVAMYFTWPGLEAAYTATTEKYDSFSIVVALIFIGAVLYAWSKVGEKGLLNNKEVWKPRSAAFTALNRGAAAVLLFVIASVTGGPNIQEGFWVPVLIAGVLNIGIQFAGVRARTLEDLSLVTPISSSTPTLVILVSMLFLGEYPTSLGVVGIGVVAFGTYTLQLGEAKKRVVARQLLIEKLGRAPTKEELDRELKGEKLPQSEESTPNFAGQKAEEGLLFWIQVFLAPILSLRESAGVRWAFFGVFLACFALTADGVVARTANVAFGSAIVFGITALGNGLIALARSEFSGLVPQLHRQGIAARTLGLIVFYALVYAGFTVFTNAAFRLALVPYVGSLKRLNIPLTILAAMIFLGERKNMWWRLAGGVIVTIGVVMINMAMG